MTDSTAQSRCNFQVRSKMKPDLASKYLSFKDMPSCWSITFDIQQIVSQTFYFSFSTVRQTSIFATMPAATVQNGALYKVQELLWSFSAVKKPKNFQRQYCYKLVCDHIHTFLSVRLQVFGISNSSITFLLHLLHYFSSHFFISFISSLIFKLSFLIFLFNYFNIFCISTMTLISVTAFLVMLLGLYAS